MQNQPQKIIVHHTASTIAGPQFMEVNQWHKDRAFLLSELGFYVGYHYLIEKDGQMRTAKREYEEGCHTKGQNMQSIGICLAGNFDVEDPTPAQIGTLGDMLVSVSNRYAIDPHDIYPHRSFSDTHCFGQRLGMDWARAVYFKHEISRFNAALSLLEHP